MRLSILSVTVFLLFVGCASSNSGSAPSEREWQQILAEYRTLEATRAGLPAAPADAPRKERVQVAINSMRQSEAVWTAFLDRLRAYYERTGDARAATIYADEKVRIGDSYRDLLSRWDRAQEMYSAALALDPTHQVAHQRLADAQQRRYVSIDAFSRIREGMTETQVQAALGLPREDWIRQQVQGSRVLSVWIYPKNDGGAAAVYFEGGVVYHVNWNAAPAPRAP